MRQRCHVTPDGECGRPRAWPEITSFVVERSDGYAKYPKGCDVAAGGHPCCDIPSCPYPVTHPTAGIPDGFADTIDDDGHRMHLTLPGVCSDGVY